MSDDTTEISGTRLTLWTSYDPLARLTGEQYQVVRPLVEAGMRPHELDLFLRTRREEWEWRSATEMLVWDREAVYPAVIGALDEYRRHDD